MRGGYGGGLYWKPLHSVFSYTLNGMKCEGISILQSMSVKDRRILLSTVLEMTLKSKFTQMPPPPKNSYLGKDALQSGPSPFYVAVHSMAPPECWGGVVTIGTCKWSIPNRSRLSAWTRHSPLPVISICKEACLWHVSDHSLTQLVSSSHNLLSWRWVTCKF